MVDVATFCGNCGNASTGVEDRYCRKCGSALDLLPTATTPETPTGASTLTAIRPHDETTPVPPGYPQNGNTGQIFRQQSTNGLAVASLVLGILWLYWLGSILALVFGYIARKQIDKSNGEQKGRGLATAGIVLGWVAVGVAIVGIVVGIFVFAAGQSNKTGDRYCETEKSTISVALEAYKAVNGAYPATMSGLTSGGGGFEGALLKSVPADYTIDGSGNITAIPNNAGSCT